MKKSNYLLAGIGIAAGAAVAYKLARRPADIPFEQFADVLENGEHSRFAEVDGTRIHFQDFGEKDAPVLLLIHGYGASTYTWHLIAPELAEKGFRVIAPDLVGFGFSGKPRQAEYTIDSQAWMIHRLMDVLGIGRATLIGSSYGGGVAAQVALNDWERVEKLVLVGAVSNNYVKSLLLTKLSAVPLLGEVMTPILAESKSYLKARLTRTFAAENHHLITEERMKSVSRPMFSAGMQHALLTTLRNWDADQIEKNAHRIEQPTLLIWGEGDQTIPLENGRKLHSLLPNSRLVVFKNSNHLTHEEYPHEFIDLVTEFAHQKVEQPLELAASVHHLS